MALTLNLQKSEQTLKLCLQKKGIATPPPVDFAVLLDVSGSFEDEHASGITNDLITRLVPWGMTFDPDRKLDVITFSDGQGHVENVGSITEDNYPGFVKKYVINKVRGWCGGTDYSYAIEEALRVFGWLSSDSITEKASGFFGSLFGKKTPAKVEAQRLAVAFIITDGQNYDQTRTEQIFHDSELRGDKVYFMFIGVSNNPTEFRFVDQMADMFSNVGIVKVPNIRKFVEQTDEQLNEQFITDEFVNWLKN
jgi:hypothetical protein